MTAVYGGITVKNSHDCRFGEGSITVPPGGSHSHDWRAVEKSLFQTFFMHEDSIMYPASCMTSQMSMSTACLRGMDIGRVLPNSLSGRLNTRRLVRR